jgi:hypothetical protein
MDDDARRAIALIRLGELGPLVSACLEHGDLTAYFVEAASQCYVMPPDGSGRAPVGTHNRGLYFAEDTGPVKISVDVSLS